jgi:heat shock protein HslJ
LSKINNYEAIDLNYPPYILIAGQEDIFVMKPWWFFTAGLVILAILVAGCTTPSQPAKPVTTPAVPTAVPTPVNVSPTLPVNATQIVTAVQTKAPVVNATAPVPPAIIGSWDLTGVTSYGSPTAIIPGTKLTAVFNADGSASGGAGCNDFTGSWKVDGKKLVIANITPGKKVCSTPAGVMSQESMYLSILGNAASWSVTGDALAVSDTKGTNKLIFKKVAVKPVTPPAIVGSWNLTSFNVGGNTTTPIGKPVNAVFSQGGNLTGTDGCKVYAGSWKVEGSNLTLGKVTVTEKGCDPSGMTVDSGYINMLQGVSSFTVKNKELILSDKTGSVKIVLKSVS